MKQKKKKIQKEKSIFKKKNKTTARRKWKETEYKIIVQFLNNVLKNWFITGSKFIS